jgi:hypothetical protein
MKAKQYTPPECYIAKLNLTMFWPCFCFVGMVLRSLSASGAALCQAERVWLCYGLSLTPKQLLACPRVRKSPTLSVLYSLPPSGYTASGNSRVEN